MSSLADSPEFKAARRFIALKAERKIVKARLDELNGLLAALEPPLLSYFAAAGLKNLTLDGTQLYTHRDPFVRPMRNVSRQEVCETLKLADLGYMVKENFSTESLTYYIKQLEIKAHEALGLKTAANGQISLDALRQAGLHDALANILNIRANFSLRTKKGDDPYAEPPTAETPEGEREEDDFNP